MSMGSQLMVVTSHGGAISQQSEIYRGTSPAEDAVRYLTTWTVTASWGSGQEYRLLLYRGKPPAPSDLRPSTCRSPADTPITGEIISASATSNLSPKIE